MINIEDYKDRFLGKTIFILGNGPSLNVLPVTKLSKFFTLAVNYYIPYGLQKFKFTPDFWASSYGALYPEHYQNIFAMRLYLDQSKICLVLPEDYFSVIREGWKPPLRPVKPSPSIPGRISEVAERFQDPGFRVAVFPQDLLPPRFFGVGVITHLAIPFCCYLGFKKIVFVGMDLGGWNEFYSPRPGLRLRKYRIKTVQPCWDGKQRSNIDAVRNLNWAIFSRRIPEYNRVIPEDVKFYHTTPRPKRMSSSMDKFKAIVGLSKEGRTGFMDFTGEGFYIHKLEDFINYVNFDDALELAMSK